MPLDQFFLLDTPREKIFDRFAELACRAVGAETGLITLIDSDSDRQFFKASFGLGPPLSERRETPLDYSFCVHVVAMAAPLQIDEAFNHPLVRNNPSVLEYGIQAYIGVPIFCPAGTAVGAVCALSTRARLWMREDHDIMNLIGRMVDREIMLAQEARSPPPS